tara:strand:- start:6482 stop:6709 length:228 start_codon:yes stop_codon:yes gene_type:complete
MVNLIIRDIGKENEPSDLEKALDDLRGEGAEVVDQTDRMALVNYPGNIEDCKSLCEGYPSLAVAPERHYKVPEID